MATSALRVNFKKNEKQYDATKSAVFKMLLEVGDDPSEDDEEGESNVMPPALVVEASKFPNKTQYNPVQA